MYDALRELIKKSQRIVFFGGAGVSTESGIPDFRSQTGIYSQKKYPYDAEVMVSSDFFYGHPKEFYDFYFNEMVYEDAQPNDAHLALAKLEKQGKLIAVITQNIDGLHQKAGSKKVYELHGSIHRNYCERCHQFYDLHSILTKRQGVPRCDACNGRIKPDVVLYGESLDMDTIQNSIQAINNADLLIVGGTSLNVYPAAGLIRYFRGDHLVLINKSSTPMDHVADMIIHEPIGEVLRKVVLEEE